MLFGGVKLLQRGDSLHHMQGVQSFVYTCISVSMHHMKEAPSVYRISQMTTSIQLSVSIESSTRTKGMLLNNAFDYETNCCDAT